MLKISERFCGHESNEHSPDSIVLIMSDVKLIKASPFQDIRGIFETTWDSEQFEANNIKFTPTSHAFSHNRNKGTLRGMHYQLFPFGQSKLVSCSNGRILDVVVDLRPKSPSYLRWSSTVLWAGSGRAIYVPIGFAHGFQTLTDNSTVVYLIEGKYVPEASAAVRWNDPNIGIRWSISDPILSERDRLAPDFIF